MIANSKVFAAAASLFSRARLQYIQLRVMINGDDRQSAAASKRPAAGFNLPLTCSPVTKMAYLDVDLCLLSSSSSDSSGMHIDISSEQNQSSKGSSSVVLSSCLRGALQGNTISLPDSDDIRSHSEDGDNFPGFCDEMQPLGEEAPCYPGVPHTIVTSESEVHCIRQYFVPLYMY